MRRNRKSNDDLSDCRNDIDLKVCHRCKAHLRILRLKKIRLKRRKKLFKWHATHGFENTLFTLKDHFKEVYTKISEDDKKLCLQAMRIYHPIQWWFGEQFPIGEWRIFISAKSDENLCKGSSGNRCWKACQTFEHHTLSEISLGHASELTNPSTRRTIRSSWRFII